MKFVLDFAITTIDPSNGVVSEDPFFVPVDYANESDAQRKLTNLAVAEKEHLRGGKNAKGDIK